MASDNESDRDSPAPPPAPAPPPPSQTLPTGASRLTRRIARIANDVRTRNANDKTQRIISHGWFATVAQEQEQEQLVAPEALQEVTQETRAFR
jgi:hypothetical protein